MAVKRDVDRDPPDAVGQRALIGSIDSVGNTPSPLRSRKRAKRRFWRMRSLPSVAAVHGVVTNHRPLLIQILRAIVPSDQSTGRKAIEAPLHDARIIIKLP